MTGSGANGTSFHLTMQFQLYISHECIIYKEIISLDENFAEGICVFKKLEKMPLTIQKFHSI